MTGLFAETVQSIAGAAPLALRQQLVAGFDPSDLNLSPPEASRFAQTVAACVAADARVRRAAISTSGTVRFGLPAQPKDRDRLAALVGTTSAWIDVMDLKLLTGRRLTDSDDASAAVLSLRAADEIAPGASPLGMLLRVTDGAAERQVRVVGVIADNQTGPAVSRPDPVVYVRFPAELETPFVLYVRTDDPDGLRPDLMSLINQVDARITWTSLRRGDAPFQQDSKEMGYLASGVGAGGLVALLLSATGLYAVMSYVVTLRRREIGVRLAIGAPPARILSLILRQSMKLVLIGIGVGLLLAITPALRASRVDPISTLRQD